MGKYLPKLPFGSMAFEMEVDYNQTAEQMVKALKSAWYEVNPSLIPLSGKGEQRRLFYLVPFFKDSFSTQEATSLVEKLGLQHGTAEDLFALLSKYSVWLNERKVGSIVEFGTRWIEFGEEKNIYSPSVPDKVIFYCGRTRFSWSGTDRVYILAVAEDGVKRKIHKTPHPHLPYAQPQLYTPPAAERIFSANIPNLPGAVKVKVEVDYSQTAEQMVSAAGFGELGINTGLTGVPVISTIPVGLGNPNPKTRPKIKRTLVFVRLSSLVSNNSERTGLGILKVLKERHLIPARAEDFLSLRAEDRRSLAFKFGFIYFAVFGTIWDYDGQQICLRVNDGHSLHVGRVNDYIRYHENHIIPVFVENQTKHGK